MNRSPFHRPDAESRPRVVDDHKYGMYLDRSYGGSRWATAAEMAESLQKIDLDQDACPAGGIPLQSDGRTVYVDDLDNHTLILGSTGSKKTRLFCMPLLHLLARAGESFIVTDPKGELFERCSGYVRKAGYDIKVLDFREPLHSTVFWNPLTIPYRLYRNGEHDKAVEMVTDFVASLKGGVSSESDPYWALSASDFIIGVILLLFECAESEAEVHMKSVITLTSFAIDSESGSSTPLGKFVEELDRRALAVIKMASSLANADSTRKGIMGTADTMLAPFKNNLGLLQMLAQSDFDLATIAQEKTAVFLIIPDEKVTMHFLAASFIKQTYEIMIGVAQKAEKRILPIRLNIVLEEFANMPEIPDMPQMITAARSRNIRFFLVVQSERQLVNIYAEDAQTIKGNCANWIFLTSREITLLEEIQKLCGTVFVDGRPEPLVSLSELQMFSKARGQTLILQARHHPFITDMADIDSYPAFAPLPPVTIVAKQKNRVCTFDFEDLVRKAKRHLIDPKRLFAHELDDLPEPEAQPEPVRTPERRQATTIEELFQELDDDLHIDDETDAPVKNPSSASFAVLERVLSPFVDFVIEHLDERDVDRFDRYAADLPKDAFYDDEKKVVKDLLYRDYLDLDASGVDRSEELNLREEPLPDSHRRLLTMTMVFELIDERDRGSIAVETAFLSRFLPELAARFAREGKEEPETEETADAVGSFRTDVAAVVLRFEQAHATRFAFDSAYFAADAAVDAIPWMARDWDSDDLEDIDVDAPHAILDLFRAERAARPAKYEADPADPPRIRAFKTVASRFMELLETGDRPAAADEPPRKETLDGVVAILRDVMGVAFAEYATAATDPRFGEGAGALDPDRIDALLVLAVKQLLESSPEPRRHD